jgi:predicted nucleic acid-binding protein
VANDLISQIAGRPMVMARTAVDEFQRAVTRLAGPVEKNLADDLMNQVHVVADDPSLRAAALRVTQGVGANDIQIFGTADKLGLPIFTSDAKFLRGAAAQNVIFDAIIHSSKSFVGF